MNALRRVGVTFAFLAVLLLVSTTSVSAQCVSLTTIGAAYTQNFDTLSNTAGSTTNNLTITGWFLTESGLGARDNEQYAVDTGASNTGDVYSYGAAATTDRALGSVRSGTLIPVYGACFTNNTGSTISSLSISYTGEEWRLGTNARTDQLTFEYSTNATDLATGTWTGVSGLNFTTPDTVTVGAKNGNAAADRTAIGPISVSTPSIANGSTFWIRWNDTDASGADDGLAVDDFSLTPQSGPGVPTLTITDVSQAEGNSGTTSFFFNVSLSAPAGAGGVTFDIATADGTAQDDNPASEDNDYTARSLTETIVAGSASLSFEVQVNGDTIQEANETFFVNVTNVTGANVSDGQGQGTIVNDDVSLTPIHDIQGNGATSPLSGSVTTSGIVTARKSNGYFIQEPDASVDADPATSEGIFVFTSSAPPAAAAVGNLVQVTATIQEFVPAADLLQPPMTELVSPTTTQLSTGNPLPAAIPLTATFPDPAGPEDQLERVEGMRVSVASLTVVAPTAGNSTNEANATQTSNGVFYGVVTGLPRPSREPGIQAPDPAPAGGSIPPIPRFDANPELLRIDSDGIGGATLDVSSEAVVTGIVGPVEYTFRHYTIHPEAVPAPVVTGGKTTTAVSTAIGTEFTVGSYNVERFFDTVNDPDIGDPVLTTTAFNNRLNKVSLGIRDHLKMPDILGMVEVENLSTLQAIATKINNDAVAATQPNPQYVAYLMEGNDVGGIDVGFLVKTAIVTGATPRVTVNSVTQINANEQFVNADSSTEPLNDRPSLLLDAVINGANGATFPVTVIVNHLRSLIGVNDESTGGSGWSTVGARVRAKRLKQAESLANFIQGRQTSNPNERIILVGDFNAYEFNDGLVDMINVINGTPPPDNQTAVPGDGVDLVNPDLDDLVDTPPAGERYSYVFDGSTQNIDHVIVNQALINATTARRVEHPRINADFPAVDRNDPNTPRHLSDHDPVLGFFSSVIFASADLAITKTDSPDPVTAGTDLTYTITVNNNGPDPATSASWTDTLPAGTTFVSMPAVSGWSCTTPAVGAAGTVTCSNATFAVGSSVFTLTVHVDSSVATGTVLSNTASVSSSTADAISGNESATATTTVATSADVSITKTDSPDPVTAGNQITYTITVANAGPSDASTVSLADSVPTNTTFVSLSSPGGWSCTTPAVGSTGAITCTMGSMPVGSAVFTLVVAVDAAATNGTTITNTAAVTHATTDSNNGNNSATATTTVSAITSELSITKTDSADPVMAGSNLTYTITATNAGPDAAGNATVADTLPANTTFVSLTSPGGWSCTTPAVGAAGAVTCTNASMAVGSAVFTLTVAVNPNAGGATVLSNTATVSSTSADNNSGDNTATETTTVTSPATLSATKTASGSFAPGSVLTYSIVIANAGPAAQGDNPGDEMTDVLPSQLTLISATASSGTAVANVGTNTVTWNGAIPAGGSVTVTIQALIESNVAPGTTVTNQATINYDADGNGTNEATTTSDDPSQAGGGQPTGFVVVAAPAETADIPALDGLGLAALAALLAGLGLLVARRS